MASLVRYPGGSKNKGNYNKTGNYYILLWLPNLKKRKLISTRTANLKDAEKLLKTVNNLEATHRVEERAIRALYADIQGDKALLNTLNNALGIDSSLRLDNAIDLFVKSRKNEVSANTIKSYILALHDLKNVLKGSARIEEIEKRDYDKLLKYLVEHYNKSTVNIRQRSIKTFLRWLVEYEYLDKVPFTFKMLKNDQLPKFLKPEEIQAIYSKVDDPILLSIFKVYEATGIRLSELFSSKLDGGYLKVLGKGRKYRIIPISPDLINDYQIAISSGYTTDHITKSFTSLWRKVFIEENSDSPESIDINSMSKKMIRELVYQILDHKYADRESKMVDELTDQEKREARRDVKTIHSFRHTFAVRTWCEKGDIYEVKKLLGHSTVKVTEVYAKFPADYLRNIFELRNEVQLDAVA